jgi:hypothetical protein
MNWKTSPLYLSLVAVSLSNERKREQARAALPDAPRNWAKEYSECAIESGEAPSIRLAQQRRLARLK